MASITSSQSYTPAPRYLTPLLSPPSPSPTSSPLSTGPAISSSAEVTIPTPPPHPGILILAIPLPFSSGNVEDPARYIGTGMSSACLPTMSLRRSKSTSPSALGVEIGYSEIAEDKIRALVQVVTADPGVAGKEGARGSGSHGVGARVVVLPLLRVPDDAIDEDGEHEGGEGEEEEKDLEAGIRAYCDDLIRRLIGKGSVDRVTDIDLDIGVLLINDLIHPAPRASVPPPPPMNSTAGNKDGDGDKAPSVPAPNSRPAIVRPQAAAAGPGWILAAKIAGAAAEMGYPLDAVRRVANLAVRNLGSVSVNADTRTTAQDRDLVVEDAHEVEVKVQVRTSLARLLRDAGGMVAVNSNEPVLLLSTWGSCSHTAPEMEALMSQTVEQLDAHYGIRPVRVYAGEFLPAPTGGSEKEEGKKGFGISILNVVNTELGGPSMLQLLDTPSGSEAWDARVGKEEWEGSDGTMRRTVELGMRNWNERVNGRRSEGFTDTGRLDDGEVAADQQPENDPSPSRKEQQEMTIGESTEPEEPIVPFVEEVGDKDEEEDEEEGGEEGREKDGEEDGDRTKMKKAKGTEKGRDVSLEKDSSAVEETRRETEQTDEVKEAQEKLINDDDRKNSLNEMVGEEKETIEPGEATDKEAPNTIAEDDYEMIDRRRTLIDMVLGPRTRNEP